MYYFIRTAAYQEATPGTDLYTAFDHMARNIYDPSAQKIVTAPEFILPKVCYVSPARRTADTATQLGLTPRVSRELREIEFTMEQIMSRQNFLSQPGRSRVQTARQAFYEKLVTDELTESFEDVVRRIRLLIVRLLSAGVPSVCIGHSFFLKTLEVLALHHEVLRSPDSFLKYYDGSQKAYEFLDGYQLSRATLLRLANEIDAQYSIIGGKHE